MVEFARELAAEQEVSDRVEFHMMDALRMIEFPRGYFDLVNHRLGWSYLRTWDWPKLLSEYQRVSRQGGIIRISEGDIFGETSSPALTELYALGREAFYKAGHSFSPERDGVRSQLASLMHQHGIADVQTRSWQLHYYPGADGLEDFIEDTTLAFKTMIPFLNKWLRVPETYNKLYQQALVDMHQPDFTVTWDMLTAWGVNGRT
jgi:SAM-dependent methyltransferase